MSAEKTIKFREPPVTSYKYVTNRLMIVDWASLSYHQLHSLNTESAKKRHGILTADEELNLWKNHMFERMVAYIRLFNPMHIVLCLEGKNIWRRQFVREYYSEHTMVYYDKQSYYVKSDNLAYRISKIGDDYNIVPIPLSQFGMFESLSHRKLGDLPVEKQNMLWSMATPKGKTVIPEYKGTRKFHEWEFQIDKHYWRDYKEEFAKQLAPVFRARTAQLDCAEGDDMIYASVKKYGGDADDIIVITRDSDMSQIDNPKLKIFNHISETFVNCKYPQEYLDSKVLSGDTSDNINGMAFVDPKTGAFNPTRCNKISEGGALSLLANCPNIYMVAKANGWDDQYMRNRTLIDLSLVPQNVKTLIESTLDNAKEPPLGSFDILDSLEINPVFIQDVNQMKTIGFYALQTEEAIRKNPDIFKIGIAKDMHSDWATYGPKHVDADEVDTTQRITSDALTGIFNTPNVSFF